MTVATQPPPPPRAVVQRWTQQHPSQWLHGGNIGSCAACVKQFGAELATDMHTALTYSGRHDETLRLSSHTCEACVAHTSGSTNASRLHSMLQGVPNGHNDLLSDHIRASSQYPVLNGAGHGLCGQCQARQDKRTLTSDQATLFHTLYQHRRT